MLTLQVHSLTHAHIEVLLLAPVLTLYITGWQPLVRGPMPVPWSCGTGSQ